MRYLSHKVNKSSTIFDMIQLMKPTRRSHTYVRDEIVFLARLMVWTGARSLGEIPEMLSRRLEYLTSAPNEHIQALAAIEELVKANGRSIPISRLLTLLRVIIQGTLVRPRTLCEPIEVRRCNRTKSVATTSPIKTVGLDESSAPWAATRGRMACDYVPLGLVARNSLLPGLSDKGHSVQVVFKSYESENPPKILSAEFKASMLSSLAYTAPSYRIWTEEDIESSWNQDRILASRKSSFYLISLAELATIIFKRLQEFYYLRVEHMAHLRGDGFVEQIKGRYTGPDLDVVGSLDNVFFETTTSARSTATIRNWPGPDSTSIAINCEHNIPNLGVPSSLLWVISAPDNPYPGVRPDLSSTVEFIENRKLYFR